MKVVSKLFLESNEVALTSFFGSSGAGHLNVVLRYILLDDNNNPVAGSGRYRVRTH